MAGEIRTRFSVWLFLVERWFVLSQSHTILVNLIPFVSSMNTFTKTVTEETGVLHPKLYSHGRILDDIPLSGSFPV